MPPEYELYLQYISDSDAKAAFRRLLLSADRCGRFELAYIRHGYMKNITFFEGEARPYSVVPAKKWLLFYIRTPHETHPGLSLKSLQEIFPDAENGQNGKYKVRIKNEGDSIRALQFIGIKDTSTQNGFFFPDELANAAELQEGAAKQITVNAYERNRAARDICVAHYGLNCAVCNMSFEEVYGYIGAGYIHVHHLVSISSVGQKYVVDPIRDLRPVCPNCHAMLHTANPPLSIEDLKKHLGK
jgi:hypothetical protein